MIDESSRKGFTDAARKCAAAMRAFSMPPYLASIWDIVHEIASRTGETEAEVYNNAVATASRLPVKTTDILEDWRDRTYFEFGKSGEAKPSTELMKETW